MNKHSLVKLAIGTVLAVLLALWASSSRGPSDDRAQVGAALVPGLREALNDVAQLRIVEAGDKAAVTLKRGDKGWQVEERAGYPADVSKVREALIRIADATLIEAKTANPERHAVLGVEDVAQAGAKGVRIDVDGKVAAKLVVGTLNTQSNATFVRRNDEPQAWLVKGNLVPDRLVSNWLDKELLDIASDRVMRVEIARGEQSFAIEKTAPADTLYRLSPMPAGRELLSEYEPNGLASVLAGLRCDDVAAAESVLPDPATMIVATYRTFDGLVVEITAFTFDGKHFATLRASVDAARADLAAKAAQLNAVADHERAKAESASNKDAAPAAEVATPKAVTDPAGFIAEHRKSIDDEAAVLNIKTSGWAYSLPAYKYANIDKRLDDLLKPKA